MYQNISKITFNNDGVRQAKVHMINPPEGETIDVVITSDEHGKICVKLPLEAPNGVIQCIVCEAIANFPGSFTLRHIRTSTNVSGVFNEEVWKLAQGAAQVELTIEVGNADEQVMQELMSKQSQADSVEMDRALQCPPINSPSTGQRQLEQSQGGPPLVEHNEPVVSIFVDMPGANSTLCFNHIHLDISIRDIKQMILTKCNQLEHREFRLSHSSRTLHENDKIRDICQQQSHVRLVYLQDLKGGSKLSWESSTSYPGAHLEDSSNLDCVDPTVDLTATVPAERLKHPNVVEGLVFTKQSTAIENKAVRTMRPAAMVMFGSVIAKLIAQGFEPERLLQITASVQHTPKRGKEAEPLTIYNIA